MDRREQAALVATMADLAREAGALALRYFRRGQQTSAAVTLKEGGSPVTEADLLVDRFLHDGLTGLLPEAGWLSEETADSPARLSCRRVFVVDPIDGTRAFAAGDPRWVVSLALVEDGRPLAGVVLAPALGEAYTAVRGGGAALNGAAIQVSARASLAGATVSGPKPLVEAMRRADATVVAQPRIPSLAYRFVCVASGALDVGVASVNSHDWDIAAADLILHEAGGALATTASQAPLYNEAQPRHGVLVGAPAALLPMVTLAFRNAGIS